MNREEFLQGLQNALSGEVPQNVVQENLRYYDDYIRGERQKGRTEEDVMSELGDPRLIARTIVDTTPGAGEGAYEESVSYDNAGSEQTGGNSRIHYYDLSKWYWKLLGIVIVVMVVMFLVAIVGGILSLLIPMLPMLLTVMIIMWIVRGPRR